MKEGNKVPKEDKKTKEDGVGKDYPPINITEVSVLVENNSIDVPNLKIALPLDRIAYTGTVQPPTPNSSINIPETPKEIIKKSRLQPIDVDLNTHRAGIPIGIQNLILCNCKLQIKSMDTLLEPNQTNLASIDPDGLFLFSVPEIIENIKEIIEDIFSTI